MKYKNIEPIYVQLDAVQWRGNNLKEVIKFTGRHESLAHVEWDEYEEFVRVNGLKVIQDDRYFTPAIGDYIIRNADGLHHVPKAIFEASYEPAVPQPDPNQTSLSLEENNG